MGHTICLQCRGEADHGTVVAGFGAGPASLPSAAAAGAPVAAAVAEAGTDAIAAASRHSRTSGASGASEKSVGRKGLGAGSRNSGTSDAPGTAAAVMPAVTLPVKGSVYGGGGGSDRCSMPIGAAPPSAGDAGGIAAACSTGVVGAGTSGTGGGAIQWSAIQRRESGNT